MNTDEFYQSRQAYWQTLDSLVQKAHSSVQQLSPEEIRQLGQLYRAATSDLAYAQREFPRQRVTVFLNQLVGRAHAAIYRGEPLDTRRLLDFVARGFPRAFRETLPFTLAAFLLFMIPALSTGVFLARSPEAAQWLLPEELQQQLIPVMEEKELWTNIPVPQRPYASAIIMTNNIQVSILAFAGGMLAGLLTVYAMLFNGLIIGGLVGLAMYYGVGFELLTFMVAHGVIELSVIFMAGGSGLMIGWAILRPGLMRRRDALAAAGRRSIRLLVGAVPLLIVAGLIEGFISPNESIHWSVKWWIGIGTGLILYVYLILAGRLEWEETAARLEANETQGQILASP